MISSSYYSNEYIRRLIINDLNEECKLTISDIDIKAQTDSLKPNIEPSLSDAIIQKSIQFVEIVQECCNLNIEKINNYFNENPNIQFDESQDIEAIKENIKMRVLEYSSLFISNDDIGIDDIDERYYNHENDVNFKEKFLTGILIQTDWYLNYDQKDHIRKKLKNTNYILTKFNEKILRVKYVLEKKEVKDHILMAKSEVDTLKEKLYSINLKGHQIVSVEKGAFEKLPCLKALYLENNKITKIVSGTFVDLPKLTQINLEGNQIESVEKGAFEKLPCLEYLYLRNNKITEIVTGTFVDLPKLSFINLEGNQIKSVEKGAFEKLPCLVYLFLDFNKITKIVSGTFLDLPKLFQIYLDGNQIESVEKGAFVKLPCLKDLFLKNNKITKIVTGTFVDLPKLTQIYLEGNQIESVEKGSEIKNA